MPGVTLVPLAWAQEMSLGTQRTSYFSGVLKDGVRNQTHSREGLTGLTQK